MAPLRRPARALLVASPAAALAALLLAAAGCESDPGGAPPAAGAVAPERAPDGARAEAPAAVEPLELDEEAWRARLTDEEFQILRRAGTERPFTGDLLAEKRSGTFTCAGCDLPLFASATKFESGTGWPSFTSPVAPTHVEERRDTSHGMVRTEVLCARCDGHLGHVFPDGPDPTGLRYCINSLALDFTPAR